MSLFEFLVVAFLGLVLGSFSTALTYRIPRGISWGAKRSACTSCQNPLGLMDLIPLFSWLLSKGRCRHCQARISPLYPVIELVTLLSVLGLYMAYGFTPQAFLVMFAMPFLVALLFIDLEHMILPDVLNMILAGLGALNLIMLVFYAHEISLTGALTSYVLAAAVYGAVAWGLGWAMSKILKKEALGFGDVKFFAVAGLWLGLGEMALFCILGGLFGVLFGILWKITKKDDIFPFGPALIASFYALLLVNISF